ncbi:hypothetical protein BRD22_10290 [Halobacteriales archaeon SW_8_68_21]|nr:MAG: hypothetical protein BRD22_10290 [Halobacteriales archaeon SW_8_68_21]
MGCNPRNRLRGAGDQRPRPADPEPRPEDGVTPAVTRTGRPVSSRSAWKRTRTSVGSAGRGADEVAAEHDALRQSSQACCLLLRLAKPIGSWSPAAAATDGTPPTLSALVSALSPDCQRRPHEIATVDLAVGAPASARSFGVCTPVVIVVVHRTRHFDRVPFF